ncbi:hypothetical protein L7F22_045292 [Adiantum nelumboides]|nr:hypothetical protein [Adiantum nelumboides]
MVSLVCANCSSHLLSELVLVCRANTCRSQFRTRQNFRFLSAGYSRRAFSATCSYRKQSAYCIGLPKAAAMAQQDPKKKELEETRMKRLAETCLELVNVGHEGPSVTIPILGLGVYLMPPDAAFKAVSYALQQGYRHIDTAHLYQNEQAVGRAIRASKIPREEIFITTKLWNSDHGYASTLRACEQSLKELGVEYVDLYLVHSPLSPPQKRLDTWRAMEKILKSGKARSIGVSNYGVHHLKEIFSNCEIHPSINQVELHPFNMRKELVDFCRKENIVVEAYSPLTRGERLNEPALVKFFENHNFNQIAEKHGKSTAQILIRWCLQKNVVTIPKSVKPTRILENSQVFDFELSASEIAKLDSLDEGFVVAWDPTKSQ